VEHFPQITSCCAAALEAEYVRRFFGMFQMPFNYFITFVVWWCSTKLFSSRCMSSRPVILHLHISLRYLSLDNGKISNPVKICSGHFWLAPFLLINSNYSCFGFVKWNCLCFFWMLFWRNRYVWVKCAQCDYRLLLCIGNKSKMRL